MVNCDVICGADVKCCGVPSLARVGGGGITGLMLKDMSEYLLQAIKSHRSLFLIGRP